MSSDPEKLRVLMIGAHPDDCEFKTGGVASLYQKAGHAVHYVSVTNGESGHHLISGEELVSIRRQEAKKATEVIGITGEVLSYRDGYLEPSLNARMEMIALIRKFQPDLVITHRPNDYHPDHRATSQLVCDAAYMVTVPPVVPEVPALQKNPVIAYMSDHFQRPYPFSPYVAIDIESELDRVVDMLDCHVSQVYEWLPFNGIFEVEMPEEPDQRKSWLKEMYLGWIRPLAEKCRDLLIERYGAEKGNAIEYVEAFEISEYGSQPDAEELKRLFPFS